MDTTAIREAIAEACRQEQATHSLRYFFRDRLSELGQRLLLPAQSPVDGLVDFASQYIESVPDFLDEIDNQSRTAETRAYLNMAADFFLAPPGIVAEEEGLKALLDEAFLAQRLLEEVNDRQLRDGRPALLRLDTTRANIIVHHLLGEQLANQLESLISQCITLVAGHRQQFSPFAPVGLSSPLRHDPWREAPCMSRGACIDLRLAAQFSSGSEPEEGAG